MKDIGIENFEFWTPKRRPDGYNIAMQIEPAIKPYSIENIRNGFTRPSNTANAWVADINDPNPCIEIGWSEPKTIKSIQLHFDSDFDHPLESSLWGHPEAEIPFCVKKYKIKQCNGEVLYQVQNNHQTLNRVEFQVPVTTAGIKIEVGHPGQDVPASLFEACINIENQK